MTSSERNIKIRFSILITQADYSGHHTFCMQSQLIASSCAVVLNYGTFILLLLCLSLKLVEYNSHTTLNQNENIKKMNI